MLIAFAGVVLLSLVLLLPSSGYSCRHWSDPIILGASLVVSGRPWCDPIVFGASLVVIGRPWCDPIVFGASLVVLGRPWCHPIVIGASLVVIGCPYLHWWSLSSLVELQECCKPITLKTREPGTLLKHQHNTNISKRGWLHTFLLGCIFCHLRHFAAQRHFPSPFGSLPG